MSESAPSPTPPSPDATPPSAVPIAPAPAVWQLAHGRSLVLDRPRIMAILNVTPDSFSDGGLHFEAADAIRHGLAMLGGGAGDLPYSGVARASLGVASAGLRDISDATSRAAGGHRGGGEIAADRADSPFGGADLIDIGGESTRPGAVRVPVEEQLRRVLPVIEGILRARPDALISVDTTRAAVARAALEAGAVIVNDVASGTEDEELFAVAGAHRAGLVLMHRLRPPDADSYSDRYVDGIPVYADVVSEVRDFLYARAALAEGRGGVSSGSIVLDPGLGFGKTVTQNYALIAGTAELLRPPSTRRGEAAGSGRAYPLLSAASRKSFIGKVSGVEAPGERLAGSLAVSVAHCLAGVRLFRVHDVAAHRQALAVAARIAHPMSRDG